MTQQSETNDNPLMGLIGHWQGDRGVDIAPEPDGPDNNAYYETLAFEFVGDVDNAGEQFLDIIHYTQVVQRKSNDEVFHHQAGYWLWDAANQIVMHSFTIPRGVAIVAGGKVTQSSTETVLNVAAGEESPEWPIAQSPFMVKKAKTIAFTMSIRLMEDQLHYQQTTLVDIYGNARFEHTDENRLQRVKESLIKS